MRNNPSNIRIGSNQIGALMGNLSLIAGNRFIEIAAFTTSKVGLRPHHERGIVLVGIDGMYNLIKIA